MRGKHLLLKTILLGGIVFLHTTAFAQSYKLVETGQVLCYDHDGVQIDCPAPGEAFYGQDAQFTSNEMSFVDNGDGTISDQNTGLMWQQVPTADDFTWQQAVDYCEDLEYGGYDDWRMPSLKELFSISNFGTGWPYIDMDYFTLASGQITKDEQYWASNYYVGTTVEGGENSAFGVNHVTGHIKAYAADATGPVGGKYVRAVRGDVYGENEFVDNGDGTISDNATGLMWMQNDSEEGLDWETALAYAEDNETGGYSDWRLPDVKELQSIVDYNYSPSATDPENVGPAINPMFDCTPIVNEAGDDDYAYYWTSTSALFEADAPYYYAWYVAFGRAVNDDGLDFHGAGGVRFDTKYEGGPLGEGGERYYNYVRLVRNHTATATEEMEMDINSLQVYPNPAQNQLTLTNDEVITQVNIYSITGQLMLQETLNSTDCNLDISTLNNGIYIVRVTNENNEIESHSVIKRL